MHELSVCRALLDQVSCLALARGASAVTTVSLRLGPLAGIEPALLQAAFREASPGTVARDAELVIAAVPLRVACLCCGAVGDATLTRLSCAICGSARTRLLSGDEMLLDSVDLVFDDS
jgi:hydrogenase nickel incorporation protein HypA/HybF